jgi:hypothetical protein
MIDIVFGVIITALAIALLHLNRKIINIVKAYANLIMALQNLAQIAEEQQKVNIGQQGINDLIGQNLEILGVHTRLIEPTIAYEASAFLAWWNKKKEENK